MISQDTALTETTSNRPHSPSMQRRLFRWYSRISNFDILTTVGTQFIIFALHALHSVILARMLGPIGRGEYGTVMFYSQTMIYAGMLGTSFAIARRAQQNQAAVPALACASIRVGLVTGGISFLLVTLASYLGLPADKSHLAPLCILAALLLPLEHVRLSLLAVLHGLRSYRKYNVNRVINALVFPILLAMVWGLEQVSLPNIVLTVLLSSFISLAALYRRARSLSQLFNAVPTSTELLKESAPYGASYIASQLLGRIDSLLAIWLMSFEGQGHYAVALALVGLMQLIPNAASLFSFNAGANQTAYVPRNSFVSYACGFLVVQVLIAALFAVALPWIVPAVFGKAYLEATWIAMLLIPGLVVDGLANVAEGYARGKGRPLVTAPARVLGASALAIFAVLLTPRFPLYAIPCAASIGHTLSGLLITLTVYRLAIRNQNEGVDHA